MKTDLEPVRDDLSEFTHRRLRHTLLFGSEKGLEEGTGWEHWLDHGCAPCRCSACTPQKLCEAAHARHVACQQAVRTFSGLKPGNPFPYIEGWLRFYTTFFDLIGMGVIKPHRRETRAGISLFLGMENPAWTGGRLIAKATATDGDIK